MIEINDVVMDAALRRLYNNNPRYHGLVRMLGEMILHGGWSAMELIAFAPLAQELARHYETVIEVPLEELPCTIRAPERSGVRTTVLTFNEHELSALIEACNVANGAVSHPRPPYPQWGPSARAKLLEAEQSLGKKE